MTDRKPEAPTPEQIEQRLDEVAQLYELGMALREVRFVGLPAADRVRERPPSEPKDDGDLANRARGT